jgi:hypothetical protein
VYVRLGHLNPCLKYREGFQLLGHASLVVLDVGDLVRQASKLLSHGVGNALSDFSPGSCGLGVDLHELLLDPILVRNQLC